jgi:hypothetical protein
MPYGKKTAYKKGCFKMKGPSLYKFNAGLKKASAEGALDGNPKFKAAVDAAPMKKYKDSAMKKMGCAMCGYGKKKCTCGKKKY